MGNLPIRARGDESFNRTAGQNASLSGAPSQSRERRRASALPAWGKTTGRPRPGGRRGQRRYYHFQAGRGLACVPYCWNRA
jgi:hypothetical protein